MTSTTKLNDISLDESQNLISEECDKLKAMLLEKNRKYGNSVINPSRIFSRANPMEQLKVRIDDKLTRVRNGNIDEDEDLSFDLIGYLILYRVALSLSK